MALRVRLLTLILTVTLGILPKAAEAQNPLSKPVVFLRQIRIDSILLAFGADSARIRAVVLEALRDAGRLAPGTDNRVPSLDIDVAAPRSLNGGLIEPRGFIRVEVGRNLVEGGRSTKLQWERTFDRQTLPTWREFGRGTLAEVLIAVNTYLLGRNGGA